MKYFQICFAVAVVIYTEALNCACPPDSAVPFYTHWQASGVWFKKQNKTDKYASFQTCWRRPSFMLLFSNSWWKVKPLALLFWMICIVWFCACMLQEVSTSDFPSAYIKKKERMRRGSCIAYTLTSALPKPSPWCFVFYPEWRFHFSLSSFRLVSSSLFQLDLFFTKVSVL